MVLMGNLAIRLQQLNRKLIWSGQKMEVSNIGEADKLRIRNSAAGSGTDWKEVSALDSAKEWIMHTYREGWTF